MSIGTRNLGLRGVPVLRRLTEHFASALNLKDQLQSGPLHVQGSQSCPTPEATLHKEVLVCAETNVSPKDRRAELGPWASCHPTEDKPLPLRRAPPSPSKLSGSGGLSLGGLGQAVGAVCLCFLSCKTGVAGGPGCCGTKHQPSSTVLTTGVWPHVGLLPRLESRAAGAAAQSHGAGAISLATGSHCLAHRGVLVSSALFPSSTAIDKP